MEAIILRIKEIIAGISALILMLAPITSPSLHDFTLGNAQQIKKEWNSISVTTGEETTATFHVKWINWLDADGAWKPIDTQFATSSDGTKFVMLNAPFKAEAPLRSIGTSKMINDNRWDVFGKKEINESSFTMSLQSSDAFDVAGKIIKGDLLVPTGLQKNVSYILYKNAYPQGDLIYYIDFGKAPRFEKLIRINSVPTKLSYSFNLSYSDKVAMIQKVNGADKEWDEIEKFTFVKDKVKVYKTNSARGIGFKKFQIWDSGAIQKREIVDVEIKKQGQNYTLIKNLSSSFFNNAIYPVYTDTTSTFFPDPDVETTSVDGYVRREATNESWSTIRSGAGVTANDSVSRLEFFATSGSTTDNWDAISRIVTLFDTSSIPDTDSIDSATLSFYLESAITNPSTFSFSSGIVTTSPASNTALVASDYGNFTFTRQATDVVFTSWTTGAYTDHTLNSTGLGNISKTGVTKFGMTTDDDIDNTTPPGWQSATSSGCANNNQLMGAETAGTTEDPKLVVTHTATAAPKDIDEEIIQLLKNFLNIAWAS